MDGTEKFLITILSHWYSLVGMGVECVCDWLCCCDVSPLFNRFITFPLFMSPSDRCALAPSLPLFPTVLDSIQSERSRVLSDR